MQLTVRHGGDTRSRAGLLIGLIAAAGAFGAAAMTSAATAPAAHADDFTDVINNVDADLTAGQAEFSTAFTDFGSSNPADGLAALLSGVDDDFIAAPDSLYIGTVELATNESVTGALTFGLGPVPDFTAGLSGAEGFFTIAEGDFSAVATELAASDYGAAAFDSATGGEYLAASFDELILGLAGSLGF